MPNAQLLERVRAQVDALSLEGEVVENGQAVTASGFGSAASSKSGRS